MTEPIEDHPSRPHPSRAEPAHDLTGVALPRPLAPPPPTFWPFIVAVGLGAICWGLLLNLFILFIGVGIFVIGIAGLIGDWVKEQQGNSK